jgi:beta-barrel assembly-enhancing protease
MKKYLFLSSLIGLLSLVACADTQTKVKEKVAEAVMDKVQEEILKQIPALTAEQLKWLSQYEKILKALPEPACNDLFDQVTEGANLAQTLALDIFGSSISNSEEMEIGKELFSSISKDFKIIDQDARRQDLVAIFNKMLPYRSRKDIDFNIHLIESPTINAFSIAGGHVHITTGLLENVQSKDELAFIIGHEIAHIDKKHCIRKIQILKTADSHFGNIGVMAANLQLILTAPFGQADEYESDRFGAIFAHKAGFDASKGNDFFIRLKKQEKTSLMERMTRTHPFSAAREECLNKFIANGYK